MSGVLHGVLASLKAAAAAATDSFFKYVTLLLHGDGTNGAQNNTFLDGSTNNFTITRNGNTTQGSFSPFSQTGWSNFFDGNGDYFTVADNTAFNMGSSDFTLEAWVYLTATPGQPTPYGGVIVDKDGKNAISWPQYALSVDSNRKAVFQANSVPNVITPTAVINGATTLALGTWYHLAVTRVGTAATLWVNGVSDGTTSAVPATLNSATRSLFIGWADRTSADPSYNFPGYISNLRIVKGTAVYTSAFTPPTAPLTAITNTSLLTCQSNRFIDNSSNAFAITRNGDVRVEAFSPFNPSTTYSTANVGGSGYFDGTGDYLSIADSATIRFGTSAFTIQGWVYRNAAGATHTIAAKGGASTGWVLQITSTNVLRFTDTTTNIDTTTTIPASTWTHVAVVRTGTGANGLKLYINAVDSATGTSSTDFNQTDALNIGADRSNANAFNGYIASLKYTVGTAESISVPTVPATGGTVLLNFTNAGIFDNASQTVLETVGNAQVSTTQKKFGTGSMYFDGTGDRLLAPARPALNLASGDFTVECWVYFNNTTGDACVCYRGAQALVVGTDFQWSIYRSGTSVIVRPYASTTDYSINVGTVTTNTWYHVALTRSGSTFRGFLDGVVSGTTRTISGALNNNAAWFGVTIGNFTISGVDYALNGYIDDLRITNGYARYTANFTPPTAAFPDN